MPTAGAGKFDVGGVLLDRPFKIRRLGHFGFNVDNFDEALVFYKDLLGFRISDFIAPRDSAENAQAASPVTYFMRHGTDHHSFVLSNKKARSPVRATRRYDPGVTVNQITWQVGSLEQVGGAIDWFESLEIPIQRSGRDRLGSNWHTYFYDPDGHTNELYYGIEQIGWDGFAKPEGVWRAFGERPTLPQIPEQDEVQQALAQGVNLQSGTRCPDAPPARFDVEGVLLPRPFKVVRIGPVRLFVGDVAAAGDFYRRVLGFALTQEVVWEGYRCVFLRANTEHHSLALYPMALRERLGLSDHTTCLSFGLQVGSYRQLRSALEFLRERGVKIRELPPELRPGIDYSALALDPDGHTLELYFAMEQVGSDGLARPQANKKGATLDAWPQVLETAPDAYTGEPYLGPWG
jgi:catechol 2,3-dioxygenase-like lactoylglutathione lyase family enzyme